MFFRLKSSDSCQYLQLAESVRESGKLRQRILATLGRLDLPQVSGPASLALHAAGVAIPQTLRQLPPEKGGKM